MNLNGKRIVIAKTNHIGDVVISLPMAGLIKEKYPNAKVIFLNSGEICHISRHCKNVDETYDWQVIATATDPLSKVKALKADVFIHVNASNKRNQLVKLLKLVKQANVPVRVGSIYQLSHWLYCNRFAFISRNPKVNKRVLDLNFLSVLGLPSKVDDEKLLTLCQFKNIPLNKMQQALLSKTKFNLVLHPGAKTAKDSCWSIENYKKLIRSLDASKFNILISGTSQDKEVFSSLLEEEGVVDLMGKMNLSHYFNFLNYIDGIVAGSTGPLHLACAQGKRVLGLYKHNRRDIKRWGPVGNKSKVFSNPKGVNEIGIERVRAHLADWVI